MPVFPIENKSYINNGILNNNSWANIPSECKYSQGNNPASITELLTVVRLNFLGWQQVRNLLAKTNTLRSALEGSWWHNGKKCKLRCLTSHQLFKFLVTVFIAINLRAIGYTSSDLGLCCRHNTRSAESATQESRSNFSSVMSIRRE